VDAGDGKVTDSANRASTSVRARRLALVAAFDASGERGYYTVEVQGVAPAGENRVLGIRGQHGPRNRISTRSRMRRSANCCDRRRDVRGRLGDARRKRSGNEQEIWRPLIYLMFGDLDRIDARTVAAAAADAGPRTRPRSGCGRTTRSAGRADDGS